MRVKIKNALTGEIRDMDNNDDEFKELMKNKQIKVLRYG